MNKFIIALTASLCLAFWVLADDVSQTAGAVRNYNVSRFTVSRVAATSLNAAVTKTNVLQTVPGVVGKVVIIPGASNDSFEIHNVATVGGCTVSNEVFLSSTNLIPGLPVIYDLMPGWTCSSGITTVITSGGASNTISRAFVSYDQSR